MTSCNELRSDYLRFIFSLFLLIILDNFSWKRIFLRILCLFKKKKKIGGNTHPTLLNNSRLWSHWYPDPESITRQCFSGLFGEKRNRRAGEDRWTRESGISALKSNALTAKLILSLYRCFIYSKSEKIIKINLKKAEQYTVYGKQIQRGEIQC